MHFIPATRFVRFSSSLPLPTMEVTVSNSYRFTMYPEEIGALVSIVIKHFFRSLHSAHSLRLSIHSSTIGSVLQHDAEKRPR